MINHEFKVIFIHVPGTAGSYIEKMICGFDVWNSDLRNEKHVDWINAKGLYRDYWDDYFKFSIVRDLFARYMSMKRRFDQSVEDLLKKSGSPPILRTAVVWNRPDVIDYGGYYLNSIGPEMDFICRFEDLQKDINFVSNEIGFKKAVNIDRLIAGRSIKRSREELKDEEIDKLIKLHGEDMKVFHYEDPRS